MLRVKGLVGVGWKVDWVRGKAWRLEGSWVSAGQVDCKKITSMLRFKSLGGSG